jgi:hypothetical protein
MRHVTRVLVVLAMLVSIADLAGAQRRGGGGGRGGGARGGGGGGFRGGGGVRSVARPSVTRPAGGYGGGVGRVNRPATVPGRANISGGEVVNRGNINRGNFNRTDINNVDINRDWDVDDHWHGCCYHPVARAAAYTAGAAVTAAAIGSVYNTLPASCVVTTVNGVTYQQCGSTWYQPQFDGTTTTYVVVSPP